MKSKSLVQEFNKLHRLVEESTERYIERIGASKEKRKYLEEKVLPVLEREIEEQEKIVDAEVYRLLESRKDEKCKTTNKAD